MQLKVKKRSEYHIEQKKWGYEQWIVNNDKYCGKKLFFNVGGQTSYHFHMNKTETMYVEAGSFRICMYDPENGESYAVDLEASDSLDIPRGQVHSIQCTGLSSQQEAVLVEFSTFHENSDSYRIGSSSAGFEKA